MKNWPDIAGSFFLTLIGIGAVTGAIGLRIGTPTEPQPGFFPFLSGVAIIILSLMILTWGWLGRSKGKIEFGEMRRPAMLVVALILFVGLLEPLGYLIVTPFISALVLYIMHVRSWRVLLTTSLALSIGTYVLFGRLLGLMLPAGILSRIGL